MDCILNLVGKFLEPIAEILGQKVVRHVGYIVRYKKNMKELENEKEKLEIKMDENKVKVDQAIIRNDVVEEKVVKWTETAEKMKSDVDDLVVAKASDENTKCVKFYCPNICSRYQMSKQAVQKKDALEKHIQGGNFDPVAHPRPSPSDLWSTDKFMVFDSRKQLCKKIKDKLATPGVNMVGVYGAGGIGKTTIVEEVCKQLKNDGVFYEVVKGVVSRDINVREIQGHLAEKLCLKFVKETEEGRASELWNRLNNGKDNLVILDDLWQELNLRAIGIPLKDGNKGCKIILTTRNQDVLTKMEVVENVEVRVLTEDESWNLFKNKVGINFAFDELLSVAISVCKECRGLPVAILAVGGALAGKKQKDIWDDALNQLQNSSIDNKVYASLRLSYDWLGQEEKSMIKDGKEAQSILLSCCLYPEDAEIPVHFLLFHCIARELLDPINDTVEKARHRVSTLVDHLKARSLLLDGKDMKFVKMHDVIRDVVISIAKSEEQYLVKDATDVWPAKFIKENLAALSVRFNKLNEVPNGLVCPRLHTLRIESKDHSFEFPDNFFSGVGELRILELKGIRMFSIPSSLANLSKLRTLILVNCSLEDMSFLKGLKSNLEVLVIESSYIEALPTELGELSHLRVLILIECYQLKVIPAGVISKLTRLEELRFPDHFQLCVDLDGEDDEVVEDVRKATLSELRPLTKLTSLSIFIPNYTPVPGLCFDNLVSYRFAVGEKFGRGEYSQRKTVKLSGTTYHDEFATLLERAERVYLCRVEGLKKGILDRKGTELLEVEHLGIKECHGLDSLSSITYCNQSSSFSKLTQLHVEGCSFKFLFTSSCAKGLQQLQELSVKNCELLEEVIGTEGEKDELISFSFSKLKVLTLGKLPKLISFGPKLENTRAEGVSLPKGQPLFGEKVTLPSLEKLVIESCSSITEIWDEQVLPTDSFPQLARVKLRDIEELVNVFPSNMFTLAQNLKKNRVGSCEGSKTSDNQTISFPSLRELKLHRMKKLKSFCGSSNASEPQYFFDPLVILPSMNKLQIYGLPNITKIWDKQVLPTKSFPQLKEVSIEECEKLVNVFPSNLWAQSIKEVKVNYCKRVEVVFSITGVEESETANNCSIIFPQLDTLKLKNLENFKTFCGNSTRSGQQYLFDPQVILPSLNKLEIDGLPNITEIWDKQVLPTKSFPQQKNVKVFQCEKLINVFPSNLWAQSIKRLAVGNCKGVEVVFSITGVEESETANNCSIIFPQLETLHLSDLENLKTFCGKSTESGQQYLFDPQVQFPALWELRLTNLPNQDTFKQQLSEGEVQFPALVDLYLRNLPNQDTLKQQLLKGEVQFPALKVFTIDGEF